MVLKASSQIIREMANVMNQSLGGLFGTSTSATTTTTNFYDRMVSSHQDVVSHAIDKQAEIDLNQDSNDTLKEIIAIW